MYEHYYAVIMAGGGGTRLWPLSRQTRPKQMIALNGEQTLFQMAVDRLEGLFTPDRIFVVTVASQAVALQKMSPQIPVDNFLIEPMPRGTASVVGLAAVALHQRDPQAVMAVLTADHYIQNETSFRTLLKAGYDLAQENYLVTLGITPTFPATGYGYIQRGESLGSYQGRDAFRVLKFKEKPAEELARNFIQQGDHAWNSGMFIWRVERILEEIRLWMPDLMKKLDEIELAWNTIQQRTVIENLWHTIQPQTIDYGIMEKAASVALLSAADLNWNDVGSWDSIFEVLPADENGNIILGARHIGLDTSHSLVCADNSQRLIVTIGASDLLVVDTGDAVLICPREQAQRVKEVVNMLKDQKKSEYL